MTLAEYCTWWRHHKQEQQQQQQLDQRQQQEAQHARHARHAQLEDEQHDGKHDSATDELLYLKDWHFSTEFPHYCAYTTPIFFREDWLNEWLDSKAAAAVAAAKPLPAAAAAAGTGGQRDTDDVMDTTACATGGQRDTDDVMDTTACATGGQRDTDDVMDTTACATGGDNGSIEAHGTNHGPVNCSDYRFVYLGPKVHALGERAELAAPLSVSLSQYGHWLGLGCRPKQFVHRACAGSLCSTVPCIISMACTRCI
jgi:hypothetical protein